MVILYVFFRLDSEKRQIWLYESIVLLVLCLLLYVFHHTPYALLLFTVLTFLYTQLVGRVDFRYVGVGDKTKHVMYRGVKRD